MTFASPLSFSDGRCVFWVVYLCQHAPAPQVGDLVVHLPDDAVRDDDLTGARQQLFRYSWLPTSMPAPIGRVFYVEAPAHPHLPPLGPDHGRHARTHRKYFQ